MHLKHWKVLSVLLTLASLSLMSLYVYNISYHIVEGSVSYMTQIMHIYPLKQLAFMANICSLVAVFVFDTCMAMKYEEDVAFGYGLVYMSGNVEYYRIAVRYVCSMVPIFIQSHMLIMRNYFVKFVHCLWSHVWVSVMSQTCTFYNSDIWYKCTI